MLREGPLTNRGLVNAHSRHPLLLSWISDRQRVSCAKSSAQVKMARKWREREGTEEPKEESKTQEAVVEELRALARHPAAPASVTEAAPGPAVVHAVCA